jgi:uncharacterized protein (DUF362 family)
MAARRRGRTRRDFIRDTARVGAAAWAAGGVAFRAAAAETDRSRVFRVDGCPAHDGALRHVGMDTLLGLLAGYGLKLYRTDLPHAWGSPAGIVEADDVVLVKVNCQWKCRGTTNTDVVRGLIQRILEHPDGFAGEVVIVENGQGRGAFNGMAGGNLYGSWPEIANNVHVNAEDETVLTVDHLVRAVFAGQPVSSYLLDPIRARFISSSEHIRDGYRTVSPPPGSNPTTPVSYPCFTTPGGHRIELREGRWTGSGHADNVKLINVPVLKHHEGSGVTGSLKHIYGLVSMSDGYSPQRHYTEIGSQCGKFWSLVRTPDLNIVDCIWVSQDSLTGYPPETTRRCNVLLAGLDPVALDYYASKHVLLALGGSNGWQHDPDRFAGLVDMLAGAQGFINANGGVAGVPARVGDANIEVLSRNVAARGFPRRVLRGVR